MLASPSAHPGLGHGTGSDEPSDDPRPIDRAATEPAVERPIACHDAARPGRALSSRRDVASFPPRRTDTGSSPWPPSPTTPAIVRPQPPAPSADAFTIHRAPVDDGLALAYVREGVGGVPLLLVHGYPETKRIWWRNIEPLAAAGFEVIVPDLRGYGDSDLPADDGYDIVTYARDLHALVHDHLGHERCLIAASDVGGVVATDLVHRFPGFVERLCFFNTVPPMGADYAGAGLDPSTFTGTDDGGPTADYRELQGARPDELAAMLPTPAARRQWVAAMYTSRLWASPGSFTRAEVDFMTEPFADEARLRAGWAVYQLAHGRAMTEIPYMDPGRRAHAPPLRPRRPRRRRRLRALLRGRVHEPDRPARGPRRRPLPAVGARRHLQPAAAGRVRRPARRPRPLTGLRPAGHAARLNEVHGSLARPIVPVMAASVSRRRVLQGLAAGAGLAMAGCTPFWPERAKRPGDRPFPRRPEGVDCLPQIEHIVIYMQENHSYDSYFGTFRRGDGYRMRQGTPTNANALPDGTSVPVFHADEHVPARPGVSQNWNSTHIQIDGGKMDGFLRDGNTNAMKYWDGEDLPFYWSLASTFPLCDRWFTSAPCQTYPNRLYLQAATSSGLLSTDTGKILGMPPPANGTIWERLNAHGISWNDYAWDLPDILLVSLGLAGQPGPGEDVRRSSSPTAGTARCRRCRSSAPASPPTARRTRRTCSWARRTARPSSTR